MGTPVNYCVDISSSTIIPYPLLCGYQQFHYYPSSTIIKYPLLCGYQQFHYYPISTIVWISPVHAKPSSILMQKRTAK